MIKQYKLLPLPRPVDIQPRVMVGFKRPACQQGVATASEKALPHHAPGISFLVAIVAIVAIVRESIASSCSR